jgi:hypothetical protein
MSRLSILSAILFATCLSLPTIAQTGSGQSAQKSKTTAGQKPAPQGNSIDTLRNAINNIKSLFGKKKGGDTITVLVADIEYEDTNLALLKDNLRSTKGVKNLSMNYKSGNAVLDIVFKGKPSDLWDAQSGNLKQSFKLQEAGDKNLVLAYRTKK